MTGSLGVDGAAVPFGCFMGAMRSGTTLVRALFDGHSQLAVPGESPWVPILLAGRTDLAVDGTVDSQRLADRLTGHPDWAFTRRWAMSTAEVRAALDERRPGTVPDAVRALFGYYARRAGKPRYADKTPHHVMAVPRLAAAFPEMVFVHVVRDGRDVALSQLDAPFGPTSLGQAALSWRHQLATGRRTGQALGPGRYVELRYEDLVRDPEATLRVVCGALALAFEPAMLGYPDRAVRLLGDVLAPGSHSGLTRPVTAGLRDWRSQLSRADGELFEAIAGDTLAAFGYERAHPRPPARARARAEVEHAKRRLRTARSAAARRLATRGARR